MATPPNEVRAGLTLVTAAAAAEVTSVAAQASTDPLGVLLEAVPGIVDFYLDAAAELALEWYEELRSEADVRNAFAPEPVTPLRVNLLRNQVEVTAREVQREMEREMERYVERMTADIDAEVARVMAERVALFAETEVAAGFRDTITENAERDPDSVGWRRFARPEACKFCKMLAARGAVYTVSTARFAAHGATTNGKTTGGNCMCTAGPAFAGEDFTPASVMQYVASQKRRTEKQRADLRAYLNKNYPDSPG